MLVATRLLPWEINMQPITARPISNTGLRAVVTYGVLILALCLMIADFCRVKQQLSFQPFLGGQTVSRREGFSEERGCAPRSPGVAWGLPWLRYAKPCAPRE